jgi:cation transport regulator
MITKRIIRGCAMPYSSNQELPASVRHSLPEPAQQVYRKVFNSAWRRYPLDARREEISRRIAWTAVKQLYCKFDGKWVPIGEFDWPPRPHVT